ncbi:MAG: glycosyltransferase family 9 protein [Thermodesulfovibrionales bacterium]
MQTFQNTAFIYHPGTLGDVLLSLPAINKIKEIDKVAIHLCCKSTIGNLLMDLSVVEDTSDIDSSFYCPLFTDSHWRLKGFLSGFKKIYCFTRDISSMSLTNIKKLRKDLEIVNTIPNEKIHVSHFRYRQIERTEPFIPMRLKIEDRFLEGARRLIKIVSKRFIVIHPGSGSKAKNMPLEVFFNISDFLINKIQIGVLFITGEAEDNTMLSNIDRYVETKGLMSQHLSGLSLITVSSMISIADLYIGNDSGITHLAGLINKGIVVFFKESDPLVWSPIGDNVLLVYREVRYDDIFGFVSQCIK